MMGSGPWYGDAPCPHLNANRRRRASKPPRSASSSCATRPSGRATAPPLLLIMGLARRWSLWDEEFCEQLADAGFCVIRFDNRDVGRSTHLRDAGVPSAGSCCGARPRGAAYSLDDMAADAAGLLDHLGIARRPRGRRRRWAG